MKKEDLEDIKRWAQSRKATTLAELSEIRKKIFDLEKKAKGEREKKKYEVLRSVLFTLKANESEFLKKIAFYSAIESRANYFIDLIFPEIPKF